MMMGGRGMARGPAGKGARKGLAGKGENVQRMIMALTAQFRNTFEDDEGGESVEFAGTITSALMMMNHPLLAAGSTDRRMNGFGEMLAQHPSAEAKVRAIFLSCLTRQPSA